MAEAQPKLRQLGVGRRQWDDPLFAEGDRLCRLYVVEGNIDIDDDQLNHKVVSAFPCEAPGCQEMFDSPLDFQRHYDSRHRYICKECRKNLPTAHFLDLHISETHDSFFAVQAERKPMFRCYVEECKVVSKDVSQRRNHCIEAHNFPHDFRYDQSLKKNKNHTSKEKGMEECQEKKLKTQKPKTITFGRGKQGKTFTNTKPWHAVGKQEQKENSNSEISTSELMEVLPS